MEFYQQNVKEVLGQLSSKLDGLSEKEAKERIEKYGYNEVRVKKGPNPFIIFLSQFKSPLVLILLAATVISIVVGEIVDAIVIFAIVILNAIIGLIQEYRAEKSIDALKKLQALKTIVIRDGKKHEIEARELVPGDIVVLEEGSKVPADARLIEAINLQVNESSLTGESVPVNKHVEVIKKAQLPDRKNVVYSSTNITRGRGSAVITSTGMNTEIGKIAHLIETSEEKQTPLQRNLAVFGKWLGIAVIIIAAIVFVGQLIKAGRLDAEFMVEMFIVAVSLAVAAIPEGLPVVVTITLSLGVRRMVKRNALVRKLPAIETLGSTSIICSDKTGTLTHNQMTVKEMFVNNKTINVTGQGYNTKGDFLYKNKRIHPKYVKLALDIGRLCNNSSVHSGKVVGDPTEIALQVLSQKAGYNEEVKRVGEIPFDSSKKYMATIHEIKGKKVSYFKGAPEVILKMSSKIDYEGRARFMTKSERKNISEMNENMAKKALRVLAVAYRYGTGNKDLVFVGLVGMIDPARKEVKEAIVKCEHAGIRVVMITGDHKLTAIAIGHEIGLKGEAIIGEELDKMSDTKLTLNVDKYNIYARVSPEHKVRILRALKKKGQVVAMTGDGVNDAPALKDADIGVSMGIVGTDVAREASDMVLTDDNFASIVNAIEEGRGIYDNIKKFVSYLLSSNIAEVLVIFLAILFNWPLPLVAIQLLWLNLVTDGLPAIALGVDPARKDIMKFKPRKKDEKILDKRLTYNILLMGAFITIGVLFLFGRVFGEDVERARTIAFTSLVVFEIIRLYVIRADYKLGIFSNKFLMGAVALSIALQLAVLYTPLNIFFKSVPLVLMDWVWIVGVGLSLIVFNWILRMVMPKHLAH